MAGGLKQMLHFPDKPPLQRYSHWMRSRYGETDKMGYVYYGRYLEYFEVARTEMIRSWGLSYREMEERGIILPVVEANVTYKSPVHYDEEMRIEVLLFDEPNVRLFTWYQVYTRRQKEPHALGQVTLAFSSLQTRRPCRAPGYFIQRMKSVTDSGNG